MGDIMSNTLVEIENNYEIKINLKKILIKNNINRNQLSLLTGIKLDTINRYYFEKLDRVDLNILKLFCLVLHCKISDLLVLKKIDKS